MTQDETFLLRCITLAKKATGKTYPNPLVGAVIVHENQIIGEGFHQKAGEPHAEINAINSVKDPNILKKSTIYVSLEPCSHFGKTPPCANKIIEIGFKKVVIGSIDDNAQVNGQGIKRLKEAGIEVVTNVLEEQCKELNKRFFTFHNKKRPFIILKWAESKDGFIDKDFAPITISNSLSKQWSHQLRSTEQAILVGKNTALRDNPSLTTREVKGDNPIRALIDLNLDTPLSYKIFDDTAKVFVFNLIKSEINDHVNFIKINKYDYLNQIMTHLHQLEIQSIIIEGGAYTLQEFIDTNLWDEAYIIKNPSLELKNGTKAPKINRTFDNQQDLKDNAIFYYKNH